MTGVQTCALPIWRPRARRTAGSPLPRFMAAPLCLSADVTGAEVWSLELWFSIFLVSTAIPGTL